MEHQRHIFTFFICTLWWICIATNAERCNMNLCTAPSNSSSSSGLYDLRVSSQVYSTSGLTNTKIYVQVKFASCPTLQTAGPKYYKLEAYSDGKGYFEHAGLFDKPISHADAERCATNEIVFSTCEPTMDLPRTYAWNAPGNYQGEICFRLSIATDGQEDTCDQVTKCIVPDFEFLPNSSADSEDQSGLTDITSAVVTSPERSHQSLRSKMEKCYKNRNCTNPDRLIDLCGSDGKYYPSRCHARLEECLTGVKINYKKYEGTCPKATTAEPQSPSNTTATTSTASQPCSELKDTILSSPSAVKAGWIPQCDCNGHFKPVQCETKNNNCWCSTRDGAQNSGERWVFSCDTTHLFVQCLSSS